MDRCNDLFSELHAQICDEVITFLNYSQCAHNLFVMLPVLGRLLGLSRLTSPPRHFVPSQAGENNENNPD